MILNEAEIKTPNIEGEALRVFLKTIDLVGGPRSLAQKRNLTWLPSLLEASYIVVLFEHGKTESEIAEYLGITKQTVRNALKADIDVVKKKIQEEFQEEFQEETEEDIKTHIAGGLAKWAYQEIKAGNENIPFIAELYEEFSKAVGIQWPIEVLQRIRGLKFPSTKDEIAKRLEGLNAIKDVPLQTILEKLPDKIKNPADLLHQIKLAISK